MTDASARPSRGALLACLLYESLIVVAIVVVGVIIPFTLLGVMFGVSASGRVLVAHLFLVLLLYFVWQWTRGGQTLAMKTWRIRVETSEGGPLSVGTAVLRYALAWIGTLAAATTFLWALVDRDGRYLHDRLSGTRLVSVPKT